MKRNKIFGAVAFTTLAMTLAACNNGGNAGEGAGSTLIIQESTDIPTWTPAPPTTRPAVRSSRTCTRPCSGTRAAA